jgi:hypothetical protein
MVVVDMVGWGASFLGCLGVVTEAVVNYFMMRALDNVAGKCRMSKAKCRKNDEDQSTKMKRNSSFRLRHFFVI